MQISFTHHTIHPLKVYNSIIFSIIFTQSFIHQINVTCCITPKRNTTFISSYSAFLPCTPRLLHFDGFACSAHHINRIIQYVKLGTGLFHLEQCFQGSSMLWPVSGLHSLLLLNNILFHGYATCSLFIHQLKDIWAVCQT